jgi:hypothetical protein
MADLFGAQPRVDLLPNVASFPGAKGVLDLHLFEDCIKDLQKTGHPECDGEINAGYIFGHWQARVSDHHKVPVP